MQVQSFSKELWKTVEGLHTKDPISDEGEAKENQLYGTVRHWSYHSWPPSPNEHRKFETEREKVPCCDCARAKGRQFGSV